MIRMAVSQEDFAAVSMLALAQSVDPSVIGWPTFIHLTDEKEVDGFISVLRHPEAVIVGPLTGASPRSTMRLVESMDTALFQMGIRLYWACLSKDNTHWLNIVRRLPNLYSEMGEDPEGRIWFRRLLTEH